MLSAIPSEAIASNADQVSKEGASATDFIGRRAETSDHPLAFLVNGPPAFVIPPHFHEIDQYQIFVGGSATLGKHKVLPGSVHYADAYTPYGPITATEDGVQPAAAAQVAYQPTEADKPFKDRSRFLSC